MQQFDLYIAQQDRHLSLSPSRTVIGSQFDHNSQRLRFHRPESIRNRRLTLLFAAGGDHFAPVDLGEESEYILPNTLTHTTCLQLQVALGQGESLLHSNTVYLMLRPSLVPGDGPTEPMPTYAALAARSFADASLEADVLRFGNIGGETVAQVSLGEYLKDAPRDSRSYTRQDGAWRAATHEELPGRDRDGAHRITAISGLSPALEETRDHLAAARQEALGRTEAVRKEALEDTAAVRREAREHTLAVQKETQENIQSLRWEARETAGALEQAVETLREEATPRASGNLWGPPDCVYTQTVRGVTLTYLPGIDTYVLNGTNAESYNATFHIAKAPFSWQTGQTYTLTYQYVGGTAQAGDHEILNVTARAQGSSGDVLIIGGNRWASDIRSTVVKSSTPDGVAAAAADRLTCQIAAFAEASFQDFRFQVHFEKGGENAWQPHTTAANLAMAIAQKADRDNPTPSADGISNLGSINLRYRDLFLVNGPTVTSDRRIKQEVRELSPQTVRELICALHPVRYRYADESRILHGGLIAQEVEAAMAAAGLSDFAGLVKVPVYEARTRSLPGGDGTREEVIPVEQRVVADYQYGIRYHEFIPLLIRAVQDLYARVLRDSVGDPPQAPR